MALLAAQSDLQKGRTLAVPEHLRDKHPKTSGETVTGPGYRYSHDFPDAYVPQAYLPEGRVFYEPSDRGEEKRIAERLAHWRSIFQRETDN
jgi:putative ATPase